MQIRDLSSKVWETLNTSLTDLFKRNYDLKFFKREDKGKGVYEVKRYDSRTGKLDSDYSLLIQTFPKELLLD
ncbi:hypothetical protein K9L16_00210 [Candidatus Pacearchaeota archaeon]|nr:hypothetical protein [Candidatus Pacearchaeota archaeon]